MIKIVRGQVSELEPFEEKSGLMMRNGEGEGGEGDGTAEGKNGEGQGERKGEREEEQEGEEDEVKITRIRGSVRGWWSVLQGFLDEEEGGWWFLKRVRVRLAGEDRVEEGWRAERHFPEGVTMASTATRRRGPK